MNPIAAHADDLIATCWAVMFVVWIVAARSTHRTKESESLGSQLRHRSFFIAGAALLVLPIRLGPIAGATTRGPARLTAAVLLTALGVAIAIWARAALGRNWSGRITLKEDHELVRTGPYARVRHPIYSGLLTGMLGSALAVGGLRGALGFALFALGVGVKAQLEERLMAREFGDAYRDYARATWRVLPGIW